MSYYLRFPISELRERIEGNKSVLYKDDGYYLSIYRTVFASNSVVFHAAFLDLIEEKKISEEWSYRIDYDYPRYEDSLYRELEVFNSVWKRYFENGSDTTVIVGLGNYGKDFKENRHNIGTNAVEKIKDFYRFAPWEDLGTFERTEEILFGQRVILLKTKGYMNNSGDFISDVVGNLKLDPKNIIVIHDELGLSLGRVKAKQGGSANGHNGVKSIDEKIGQDYKRIRIGIGHPEDSDLVKEYVLGNFSEEDRSMVNCITDKIAENIGLVIDGDLVNFMNRISLISSLSKNQ